MTPAKSFDPTHEYGWIYPPVPLLPVEIIERLARERLPEGTPFLVLSHTSKIRQIEERAWYYSQKGTVPNENCKILKRCVA